MTKRKRKGEETRIQEECDKWLTTIGKPKVTEDKQRKLRPQPLKQRNSRPLLEIQFTQTKQVVRATKQTHIQSFFKPRTSGLHTVHNQAPRTDLTCQQSEYEELLYEDESDIENKNCVLTNTSKDCSVSIDDILESEPQSLIFGERSKSLAHAGTNKFIPSDEHLKWTKRDGQETGFEDNCLEGMRCATSQSRHNGLQNESTNASQNIKFQKPCDISLLDSDFMEEDSLPSLSQSGLESVKEAIVIDCVISEDKQNGYKAINDENINTDGDVPLLKDKHLVKICLASGDKGAVSIVANSTQIVNSIADFKAINDNLLSHDKISLGNSLVESQETSQSLEDFTEFTFHSEKWGDQMKYREYVGMCDHESASQIGMAELAEKEPNNKRRKNLDNTDNKGTTFDSDKWKHSEENIQLINENHNASFNGCRNKGNVSPSHTCQEQSEFTFHSEKWEDRDKYRKYIELDIDDVDEFTFHTPKQ